MLSGLNQKKLRNWLLLFFVALLIPTAVLIQQSYSRLKWETFHQYQLMADELSRRIDKQFLQLVNIEELRPFTDYSFLNVAGEASANFFQRSPLSHYPVESSVPGVIGYFQVDSAGKLMTPLIPESVGDASSFGIVESELNQRVALQGRIEMILSQNRLLQKPLKPTSAQAKDKEDDSSLLAATVSSGSMVADDAVESNMAAYDKEEKGAGLDSGSGSQIQSQRAFDDLKSTYSYSKKNQKTKLGRVEELSLSRRYQNDKELALEQEQMKQRVMSRSKMSPKKRIRTESNVLPEAIQKERAVLLVDELSTVTEFESPLQAQVKPLRISTFESEIDPFEFSRLDNEHFILFRKVWRNNQRYTQGILIEQQAFLENVINLAFGETTLSQMSDLLVIYQGDVLQAFSARTTGGYLSSTRGLNTDLLYQSRLSDPLSDMQLLFSITQLPVGPGGQVIIWLTIILLFVLCAGFYLLYRLGLGQILLLNQQQDFVSAVSHELKTPLTSIRMYGEMLREGWASDEKKKTYYNFIVDESERLSRLINNVLLMARLTRNKQQAELKNHTVNELMDTVVSKVSTQIKAAGFTLDTHCDDADHLSIRVDADWFSQIVINLVDNAIKFSANADRKEISLRCKPLTSGYVQFTIRDYGPGVAEQQMKKIFKLFYRTEDELTRETVGTGIGLALVHQMAANMKGRVDVINSDPGAEFSLQFPVVS